MQLFLIIIGTVKLTNKIGISTIYRLHLLTHALLNKILIEPFITSITLPIYQFLCVYFHPLKSIIEIIVLSVQVYFFIQQNNTR